MTKSPDEIMAVYLLNGGKMLSEMCPKCGAPLFETDGRKTCVVCAEREKEEAEDKCGAAKAGALKAEAVHAEDAPRIAAMTPSYAKRPAAECEVPDIDELISILTARAKEETDPARCLTLIECIRTAAEAKTILTRLP